MEYRGQLVMTGLLANSSYLRAESREISRAEADVDLR